MERMPTICILEQFLKEGNLRQKIQDNYLKYNIFLYQLLGPEFNCFTSNHMIILFINFSFLVQGFL